MSLTKDDFGKEFTWGVSTAAYQIERGHDSHSKGKSIWDVFVRQKNQIFQNQNADVACNFYNRFTRDIYLMSKLNIPNHRFSISWSRIFPNGTGHLNKDGIDFYDRVIDFSLELGITPWITLYHWDLPYELEKKGGWVNRDIVQWFGNYVNACITHFGDRVNNWIVLKEPMLFSGAGYFLGVHAPGKKGLNNFVGATHHAALSQSYGARIIKSMQKDSKVGTTFSCLHIEPFRSYEKDNIAAINVDALLNRLFIEPLLGLGYPYRDIPILKRIEKFVKQDDEKNVAFNMDFIGLQNYTREKVRHAGWIPFLGAKIIKAGKRNVETTLMN